MGSPIKRLLSTAKTSPMHENEYFQPYLPATDIVTIAAISFSLPARFDKQLFVPASLKFGGHALEPDAES